MALPGPGFQKQDPGGEVRPPGSAGQFEQTADVPAGDRCLHQLLQPHGSQGMPVGTHQRRVALFQEGTESRNVLAGRKQQRFLAGGGTQGIEDRRQVAISRKQGAAGTIQLQVQEGQSQSGEVAAGDIENPVKVALAHPVVPDRCPGIPGRRPGQDRGDMHIAEIQGLDQFTGPWRRIGETQQADFQPARICCPACFILFGHGNSLPSGGIAIESGSRFF